MMKMMVGYCTGRARRRIKPVRQTFLFGKKVALDFENQVGAKKVKWHKTTLFTEKKLYIYTICWLP